MRKTIKILLTLLLVTMLTCVFVACGEVDATPIEDVPPPSSVGGGGNSGGDGDGDGDGGGTVVAPVDPTSGTPAYLTFSYLSQAPSVFKHIYIEDFDISNIEYHVTYECVVNGKKQYLAGEGAPVTMDMLTAESREIIETFGDDEISGHYMIFVEHEVEYTDSEGNTKTKTVEGSFALHLKTKAALLEFVTLNFSLGDGGYALFGDFDADTDTATIKVEKGESWTWSEFVATFPMHKAGYAVKSVTVGGKTYDASPNTTITANGDMDFTVQWTESLVGITFDINLPDGVTSWAPVDSSLLTNFDATTGTWSVNVAKGEGFIPRPLVGNIATIDGYTFAGWCTADGEVWNFNKRAGNESFTLYALWTIRTYSVKYVLMGGEFLNGYSNTDVADLTRTNVDVNYALGNGPDDPGYDPDTTRDMMAFKPFIVTFTGIPYGSSLADFYSVCNVRSDKTDLISISANPSVFQNQITKSQGCYVVDGWYVASSYKDSERVDVDNMPAVTSDLVLYPKWTLADNLSDTELNAYYATKLFKYTVKSDGTLRIDLIIDNSVSELIIPDSVFIGTTSYKITEIGEGAIMNVKTLITVDLTGATSLTKIDKNAFAYCPNLREVKMPASGLGITYIGEDAFRGTEFINTYGTNSGENFAVIGSVLVQYVGDKSATSINIDTMSTLLANVDTIAPGAFRELTSLETVTIGEGIKYIYENAFSKSTNLKTVAGGEGLVFVAADAFDNTAYITTKPTDDTATPVDESQYLRIGAVYYRYVGTGTSAVIPEGVKVIAPNAFSTGHLVENITFSDASQITSIGTDAFSNTKWINEDHTTTETGDDNTFIQDGFVVVNGILIAKRGRTAVVELPAGVKTIATGAFDNAYITNITVPVGSGLELIESGAFIGARSLKAISFITANDTAFVDFNEGAFSNAEGEIVNEDFRIYLYQAPINTLMNAIVESDSSAIKSWKTLYKSASELFVELKTTAARFNTAIGLPVNYLYDGATVNFTSVWDGLGLLNLAKTSIVDGAIVVRSDGVESVEDLAISSIRTLVGNALSALNGEVGTEKVMAFEVDGVRSELLEYNVYAAIDQSTMEIKHIVDGAEVDGLPTFYTTQSNFNEEGYEIKIVFTYKDGNNTIGEILVSDKMVTITGYSPVYGVNKAIQFDVNYHGLASYRLSTSCTVKKPQNIRVEQCSEMAISINAGVQEINSVCGDVVLKVTMNDGTYKFVNIDGKSTFISVADAQSKNTTASEVDLDTVNLGYHTVGLRYGNPEDGYVYTTILYSVTLNTDASMFYYSIVDGGAVITGLKSGYDATIAIPARVRLNDSGTHNPDSANEYEVVGIGDGAFKNKTGLEYVYVPATVKSIGKEAFMGCTSLKEVRSFTVIEPMDSGLSSAITLVEQQIEYLGNVTVIGIADGVTAVKVPATISYAKTIVGGGDNNVDLDASYTLDVKLSALAFEGYTGTIALPDTDYFRAYAEENLAGREVTFYTEGNGDKATNFVFENYDNPTITYAYKTGKVTINRRATFSITDGVLVIPEALIGTTPATETNYGYEFNYDIVGVSEEAFGRAFEEGMRTIYLPNSMYTYSGDLSILFGAGNYTSVTQHVYDVREDAIYAPGNYFPNVQSVGNKAFYGCVSLENLDFSLATDLADLGNYAFYGCTTITEMDLSSTKITALEASTFAGCTGLTAVALPTTVTEIGDLVFDGCTALTEVTGTSALTYVGAYAFHNCTALDTIVIPAGATVADSAFDGAKGH